MQVAKNLLAILISLIKQSNANQNLYLISIQSLLFISILLLHRC